MLKIIVRERVMEKEKENRRQFKKYFKYFKIISFLVILLSILYYLFKDTKFIVTIINGLNRIHVELSIISMLFLFIYIIEKYLFYKYINFFTKKYVLISICLANSLCIILPLYLYLNEKMNTYLFLVFKITFSISFILYLLAENSNEKYLKYSKELKKKVDIYFVIILSMLSSLSIYILYERKVINQENIYVLMSILTISFIVYIFSIRKNFKSKNINELDKAIYISKIFLITSFFMIIIIKSIKNRDLLFIFNLFNRLIHNNISLSFTVIITSVIIDLTVLSFILIIRRFYFFNNENKVKKTQKEMPILHNIHYNFFDKENLNNILIKDTDKINIDKDIFDRGEIINYICESIDILQSYLNCFTIGIVGEWGSGKSTIIEFVKNKLNKQKEFIIIDDFDPWAIKSQDALILAMYNTIIENLGENIGYFKRKKVQNALVNISTNIPYIGKGIESYFENRIDDYTEYKEIKSDLEEKLENFDKKLIFIIDNLDRMNANNIIFLLTLIGTLFKLPNITYIVGYDKKRLTRIVKEGNRIDSKYIEKIINKEIFMPTLDKEGLKICLCNLIEVYGYDSKKHESSIKKICKNFESIRQFILFCNSLSKIPFAIKEVDIQYEYFILQTIKFFDYNLYLKIYDNRISFTEKDKIDDFLKPYDLKYKYIDLIKLLITSKSRKSLFSNPTIFKLCFIDINKNLQKIFDCIKELESNYEEYSNDYQKRTLVNYSTLDYNSSEEDILYFFSRLEYVINFKQISFKQKEILWNLLSICTSHNSKSLYSYLDKQNQEFKNSLDNNIKNILQCIFNNFNKEELEKFTQNQLNLFEKNKEEYCIKVFVYGLVFINLDLKKFDQFMYDLCKPIINEPIFLWDKEKRETFFNDLITRFNKNVEINDTDILNYIFRLYKKISNDGNHLYEFIEFFIFEERIYQNFEPSNFNKIISIPNDIHDLIEKYPPKDENEEKIKKDFEKKYPKK